MRTPATGSARPRLYGLMAEFSSPGALADAARATRAAGYRKLDAYTPYPSEEVIEALGHHRSRLPLIVFGGGLAGALTGFGLAWWSSVIAYPLNIGGKPLNSWPAFIVPTFETTILFASFAAVLGMLALNGLPTPYHPVFNVRRFAEHASRDGYFLCITARDPRFDPVATRQFLTGLNPMGVDDVED